ncbi:hypothetical protein [Kitasatospora sp. SUK 42]|uniref:hypothetical protein n=1 Tax=Kitasatospora sp. SUK 42 TaxID=1588882 RepID=UPI0018CBF0D2|nr:hypothetical protein [Kitasatospora sp. SUK 42]MBV2154981.1 hypothetical protein [Kitasatospora sp. SUK 42]
MIRRISALLVAAAAVLSVVATATAYDRHASSSTSVTADEETASTAGGHTQNRVEPTGA